MSLLAAVPCAYSLRDRSGAETEKGEAEIDLDKEAISVRPLRSQPFMIALVDIIRFKAQDYRIELALQGGHALSVFDLGQKFDDFASAFTAARNEMMLKFLLMGESERKKAVIADVSYSQSSGTGVYEGCSIGFYETCMIFSPAQSDPVKLRYGDISKWDAKDYSIVLATDTGQSFSLTKLGKEFDAVESEISEAMNALDLRTQSLLKTVAPAAEPLAIRSLARLMRDGRAAAKQDIDAVSPAVWSNVETKLGATPLRDSYEFLKSIGRTALISAGVKRGLMGDLTGNYLWLLIPIFGEGGTPGNAVAFESVRLPSVDGEAETKETTQESEVAGATYFFRIAGRTEYPALPLTDLQTRAAAMIRDINRLMLDINFRREPIFLSEDQIADPSFARYRFALSRLDSLRRIRQLYIGRVIHSSIDQWRADVQDLLSFNVTSKDDSEKWRKSQ